ncbi:MAG TPA: sensor domain-containing diguanylate cyclase, partial [Dissulfurispiraceae bacterium]|nr:sensor domain-containing diguanylate cyclase [Dissulfurispiraceae bacterium]
MSDAVLSRRLEELEERLQMQTRHIHALEKIRDLLERERELETANRSLSQKIEELRTYWDLCKRFSVTLNTEELFRLAVHLIGRSLQVDSYALMLLEEESDRLVMKAAFGLADDRPQGLSLRLGEGISGLVGETGQPILVPDVSTEARFAERAYFPAHGAFLCVPLRIKDGRVIGVLNAHKPGPQAFISADLEIFQTVAAQLAAALQNAQLYQRTRELNARDDLTGLFNRRYFFEALEAEIQRARRYRRVFTLLMLDLDHFKHYNDTHGHLRGDEALRELGRLLLHGTRRADVVARFGGEEFVVILPEINKAGGAVAAEKIRAAVERQPFSGRDRQPGGTMSVTIGVAT